MSYAAAGSSASTAITAPGGSRRSAGELDDGQRAALAAGVHQRAGGSAASAEPAPVSSRAARAAATTPGSTAQKRSTSPSATPGGADAQVAVGEHPHGHQHMAGFQDSEEHDDPLTPRSPRGRGRRRAIRRRRRAGTQRRCAGAGPAVSQDHRVGGEAADPLAQRSVSSRAGDSTAASRAAASRAVAAARRRQRPPPAKRPASSVGSGSQRTPGRTARIPTPAGPPHLRALAASRSQRRAPARGPASGRRRPAAEPWPRGRRRGPRPAAAACPPRGWRSAGRPARRPGDRRGPRQASTSTSAVRVTCDEHGAARRGLRGGAQHGGVLDCAGHESSRPSGPAGRSPSTPACSAWRARPGEGHPVGPAAEHRGHLLARPVEQGRARRPSRCRRAGSAHPCSSAASAARAVHSGPQR